MRIETLVIVLIAMNFMMIGGLVFFGIAISQSAKHRHQLLWDLVDGRMTELIELNKKASELLGRAAERGEQLIRDQQEKEQSDANRRIYATEQANRIITEQEKPKPDK